jgi:hypothetical protein
MKPSRFTEKQIIGILREQETGAKTADTCCKHGISRATLGRCIGCGEDTGELPTRMCTSTENKKSKQWDRMLAGRGPRRTTVPDHSETSDAGATS